MNRIGYSFAGWTEIILVVTMIILGLGIWIGGMNSQYGQNNDASFGMGLQDDTNAIYSNMTAYQKTYESSVNTGTASFASVFGLTLSTSYDVILASVKLLWMVISGGWISKAVALMNLPSILGSIFQLMYLLSIGFILLQLLFRTLKKP